LWNLILRSVPGDSEDFMLMAATNGGTGGRPGLDGLSATAFPSGVKGTPMEVLESIAPVVIWRKELRGDSGGAGAYRGGLGQEIEVAHRHGQSMELLAAFDRIKCPPRGVNGGLNGAAGYVGLDTGEALSGKGAQIIPPGRRLVIRTPGGGGWGNPRQRPGAMIAADVRQGLVTPAAAAKDYGFEG
jgi:N-methylhydantoinase B